MSLARSSEEEGFTLAELLISLLLLSLISALIASGVGLGYRMWTRFDDRGQVARGMASTENGLRLLMEKLQVLHKSNSPAVDFEGFPDRLEGLVALPAHIGLGGLYRLILLYDRDRHELRLKLAPYDPKHQSPGDLTTVAGGVEALQLRYFGRPKGGADESWQEVWRNEDKLPKQISIKLTTLHQQPVWPAFIIAPRIDPAPWN